MLTQLVKQVITSSFNGCYCRVRRFLNSHLTGGQTQVQLNDRHFVRMIFFQTSLEVYQLWTESLQALIQFFNQVIDFSFKIGRFVDSITKVDVHFRPRERGADPLKLVFRPYKRDSTPARNNGNEKCTLDSKNTSFTSWPSAYLQQSTWLWHLMYRAQCGFRSGEWIVTTSRRLCAGRRLSYCCAHFQVGERGLALLSTLLFTCLFCCSTRHARTRTMGNLSRNPCKESSATIPA